jgi:threonine/homoserine/homoserine lactone efflux protein
VVSALGMETGNLVHMTAAAAGIAALVASSAVTLSVLKYAGAGYLIYLGIRTLVRKPQAMPLTARQLRRATASRGST